MNREHVETARTTEVAGTPETVGGNKGVVVEDCYF